MGNTRRVSEIRRSKRKEQANADASNATRDSRLYVDDCFSETIYP